VIWEFPSNAEPPARRAQVRKRIKLAETAIAWHIS